MQRTSMKRSFIIYENWALMISKMPDQEAGNLIKKICNYELNGEVSDDGSSIDAIFAMIKAKIDEDTAKYEETCKIRREIGSKGGKQKAINRLSKEKQILPKGKQKVANGKQMYSDTDTDNDTDNEYIIKKKIYKKEKAEKMIQKYHDKCPSLPKVTKITDKRVKEVDKILREYTEEEIDKAFMLAEESDFLRNGNGTWKGANFDWITDPNNMINILEGNYSNTKKETPYESYKKTISAGYDFEALEREVNDFN